MKTFITSFNEKLFHEYGKNFLNGWKEFANDDLELIVCFEGDINKIDAENFCTKNIKIIPIESDQQLKFHKKFSKFIQARGLIAKKDPEKPGYYSFGYNYRYDAIRFSFKIFAYHKCLEKNLINNDFAWIDADMVCLKAFSSADMDEFFPHGDQLISYIGRDHFPKPNPYSECGFIGFNFSHPLWKNFIKETENLYMSGDIFLHAEWHDSYLFDKIRIKFEVEHGTIFKNIAKDIEEQEHPFSKTRLSAYFDHLKGPIRKKQGHS